MSLSLTDRQTRTVGAAATTLSALVIVLTVAALAWLLAAFLDYFSVVFLPLAVGALGALVFRPYYELLRRRLRLPSTLAVGAVFLSVLLPLGAFLWFFGSLLLSQLVALAAHLPEWFERFKLWVAESTPRVQELLDRTGMESQLRDAVVKQQGALLEALQGLGSQAFSAGLGAVRRVGALFGWVVVPVYFAYFLTVPPFRFGRGAEPGLSPPDGAASADADRRLLPFLKAETRRDVLTLAQRFIELLVAFFRGQLIIAAIQGVLYAVGFTVIGLKYGFALGLLFGFLSVVPYLGALVGLSVTVPLALLQPEGGLSLCLLTLLVFVTVQQLESWVLTPRIMGDRTGLHFMVIIVAVFFWGAALDGILGMVLAIPLTAFLVSVWRLVRDKYVPEVV